MLKLILKKKLENQMKSGETGMLLLCNPSNPTGACFSEEHLKKIVALCEKYSVPILADEIYANMNFEGKFTWVAEVSEKVPVISVGGIAKRFLAPGWRLGWFTVNNRSDAITPFIRSKLTTMCQRVLGPCGPLQGALPEILLNTPPSYYKNLNANLQTAAKMFYNGLKDVKGLLPVMPGGAMYLMVKIDIKKFPKYKNDLEFCNDMVTQQAVFCLPGSIFDFDDSFRIVVTVPKECIDIATSRIRKFCEDNYEN